MKCINKINGNEKMSHCLTQDESIAMAGVVERFMKECRGKKLMESI